MVAEAGNHEESNPNERGPTKQQKISRRVLRGANHELEGIYPTPPSMNQQQVRDEMDESTDETQVNMGR